MIKMKRIKIDRKKCIGCLTSTTACKVSHGSRDIRVRIVINSKGNFTQIYCRHCTRPECVYACPTGAMRKYDESKYVIYDKSRCTRNRFWDFRSFVCHKNCGKNAGSTHHYRNQIR